MAFILLPLISGPVEFVVAVIFISCAISAAFPVSQMLVSDLMAGGPRVKAAAYTRAILNVGISLGALAGAGALAVGTRSAYDTALFADAASFFIAAALMIRLPVPAKAQDAPEQEQAASAASNRHPLRQPRLVAAAAICGVLYLNTSILDVGIPLQVSQHTSAPRWMIGTLLLLNTLLALTFQVRASAGAETMSGAARANQLAGIALLGSCALFLATTGRAPLIAAVILIAATVLLTAGELFSSAALWGISYGLAPPGQQGSYLASFSLISQLPQVFGPGIVAVIVIGGPAAWSAAGLVFLAAGLATPFVVRSRPEAASARAS